MSAQRVNLLQSAAQTATGQSGAIAASGITEVSVFVDVTAVSGTTPQLTVYLQASDDGGSTWYDLPHDGAVILSTGHAQGANEAAGNRNIVTQITGVLKAMAKYTKFGDTIRVAWVISGTTPSFTFNVDAVGK